MTRYPEAWSAWHAQTGVPDGAESFASSTARMHAVLAKLAAESGEPALIVSHGGIMRLWLLDVVGTAPPPIHNGATWAIEHDGSRFSARLFSAPRSRRSP